MLLWNYCLWKYLPVLALFQKYIAVELPIISSESMIELEEISFHNVGIVVLVQLLMGFFDCNIINAFNLTSKLNQSSRKCVVSMSVLKIRPHVLKFIMLSILRLSLAKYNQFKVSLDETYKEKHFL